MTADPFQQRVIACIKRIPKGKVATYGLIAAMAGNPRSARQVVRALHSSSAKEGLPWQRVVNAKGQVSLPAGSGLEEQTALLKAEGVTFDRGGRIDLGTYLWGGSKK
ncbi:MAG: MGMT family protein [candidate division Zixibacteria bacterium]|nr:MGMT family protein [candidate division Zixibacteria bacterium]